MCDWNDIVGDFPNLKSTTMENKLGQWVYFYILCRKDAILDGNDFDEPDQNPHLGFETLHQALNPKKKEEKYTWHGTKEVAKKDSKDGKGKSLKNKDGKIVKEKITQDWPVSKFVTINGDTKKLFGFVLNRYFREIQMMYNNSKKRLPPDETVLSEVLDYSTRSCAHSIAAMVIKSAALIDINRLLPDNGFVSDKFKSSLHQYIKDKAVDYFKHEGADCAPLSQLDILTLQYVKFVKLMCVLMTNTLYHKRGTVAAPLFFSTLRTVYTMMHGTVVHGNELELSAETCINMQDYIDACKDEKLAQTNKRKAEKEAKAAEKKVADENSGSKEEQPDDDGARDVDDLDAAFEDAAKDGFEEFEDVEEDEEMMDD